MCGKRNNKRFFVFGSIPDQYETQEMCDTVVSADISLKVCCHDKYMTHELFDSVLPECSFLIVYCPDK